MLNQNQEDSTQERIGRASVTEKKDSGYENKEALSEYEKIIEGFSNGHLGINMSGGYIFSREDGFEIGGRKYNKREIVLSGNDYTSFDEFMKEEDGETTAKNILFKR